MRVWYRARSPTLRELKSTGDSFNAAQEYLKPHRSESVELMSPRTPVPYGAQAIGCGSSGREGRWIYERRWPNPASGQSLAAARTPTSGAFMLSPFLAGQPPATMPNHPNRGNAIGPAWLASYFTTTGSGSIQTKDEAQRGMSLGEEGAPRSLPHSSAGAAGGPSPMPAPALPPPSRRAGVRFCARSDAVSDASRVDDV